MALLLDTGVLYAYYDRSDSWHKPTVALFRQEQGALVVPAPAIPEVDHLLCTRLGFGAQEVFYKAIIDGHYLVADLPREKYARVLELNRQFSKLALGFVDAAIIAISEAIGLPRIATTDRRDFEPVAAALSLTLLP